MEKISFKIELRALEALTSWMDDLGFTAWSKEQRFIISIMDEVLAKMRKKCIDKRNADKKFKMNLKYYEAYALEKACRMLESIIDREDMYSKNVALDVANQIDQQL